MVTAISSFFKPAHQDSPIQLRKDLEQGIRTGNLNLIKEIFTKEIFLEDPLPNGTLPNGLLPLNMAVCENQAEIVAFLLEQGANPELRDFQNLNAIDHAALMRPEMLKTILEHKLGKELNDLLQVKPGLFELQEMKERIQKLALVTPLAFMNMSEIGRQAFTGQLIQITDRDAIDTYDENGMTPIQYAILGNQLPTLQLLIESGADLNVTDREGNSLLHLAALKGSKEAIQRLIQAGLDPNIQNAQGETPLHFAALKEDLSTVEVLTKAGAKISLLNQYGHSPLALIGSSSSERDPLRLNPLQLVMFAAASVDWICQLAAASGWISDSSASMATSVAAVAAFISHMMELSMIPRKNPAMIPLMQILRNLSIWIDIPVRTYSLYYLGTSTLQGMKTCWNNFYRKKAVALNVLVHAVTTGHSLQALANKCKLAWNPEKPPAPVDPSAAVAELQKQFREGAEKYEVCRALDSLRKQNDLKFHPDKNKNLSGDAFIQMRNYFDSLMKFFGCSEKNLNLETV